MYVLLNLLSTKLQRKIATKLIKIETHPKLDPVDGPVIVSFRNNRLCKQGSVLFRRSNSTTSIS